jgi:hypothetical protein
MMDARNGFEAYWKGENNLLQKRRDGILKYKQIPVRIPTPTANAVQVSRLIVFL